MQLMVRKFLKYIYEIIQCIEPTQIKLIIELVAIYYFNEDYFILTKGYK